MPIQSDDIKLLKSAVMADVPEGGGGATGLEIVDGTSNNLFNDISTDDRAQGDFALRKLFGIAQTDDVDTLLGPGFSVMEPPEDPNVSVLLFETPGWFDERTDAVDLVERYRVKGPRLLCRIADVHYTGTNLLQLYNPAPGEGFPASGDSIVLRNPSGQEEYFRILKNTVSQATVQTDALGPYVINVCNCELNKTLQFDVLGFPISRTAPSASAAAVVYSTTPAQGAIFYGVKPLGVAAEIGDRSVQVEGGIMANLVPASTVDQPVTDQYPLLQRPTLSRTATAALSFTSAAVVLTAGTVLQLPTAVQPGSLTMNHGATAFTSNAAGELLQGALVVGSVSHAGRTITLLGTAPAYGSASNTISYLPATIGGATAHSLAADVTDSNQSGSGVMALEPPPAPGTLLIKYMYQGRWYDLLEDGSGKLAGADSSYGSGTLNFVTGSLAYSFGALPDVGSSVIVVWGDKDSARAATGLPSRAFAQIPLSELPAGQIDFAWNSGGAALTASRSAAGVVTGPAQIEAVYRAEGGQYFVPFSPDSLPDGAVTVTYLGDTEGATFTNDTGGDYTLTDAPIEPGSLRFRITGTAGTVSRVFDAHSVGTEIYVGATLIGSLNNTTGAVALNSSATVSVWSSVRVKVGRTDTGVFDGAQFFTTEYYKTVDQFQAFALDVDGVLQMGYLPAGGATSTTDVVTASWAIDFEPAQGQTLVTTGAAFQWAGQKHFTRDGGVYKGWHAATGVSEQVGAASAEGNIALGTTPAGASNAVVWYNAAVDASGGLDVLGGVFSVPVAPIQAGQFQLQSGSRVGSANSGGIISGDFVGLVDSVRGIVRWLVADLGPGAGEGVPVRADELTYNAVYLQDVPIDESLLGLGTTRLPRDGKVPIYYAGKSVVVHNTLTTVLPNPLTQGASYSLGRERIAHATLRDAGGLRLSGALFELDSNPGTVSILAGADISGFTQPITVHHRVEDELNVLRADLSGRLDLAAGLTHDYPADTSYVSGKLRLGDRFARLFNVTDRSTWLGNWDDTFAGTEDAWQFNQVDFPITTTNRGAITERWAAVFLSNTTVRIFGEGVGQVLSNSPIASVIEAINPNEGVPYFSIPAAGWGGGQSAGDVLLFETVGCGGPIWAARCTMPGASAVLSDKAVIALRSDVDRP